MSIETFEFREKINQDLILNEESLNDLVDDLRNDVIEATISSNFEIGKKDSIPKKVIKQVQIKKEAEEDDREAREIEVDPTEDTDAKERGNKLKD